MNLLTLSRDFLNLMIPVRGPSAAVMRGAEEAETVIATTETSYGFSLHVSVKAEATDAWTLTVTLNPAPSGWIEVHLGQVLFRAPLHADGTARLFDIPSALLNAPDGPALAITLTLAPAEQGF